MGDLIARRRRLAAARTELLARPEADLSAVPRRVAASWRRSLARGVDPAAVVNRYHPDLDVGSRLVRYARPVIEQLTEQVAGIPACLVLTDARARLLLRVDTAPTIGRCADYNNFAEGFGYEEGAVGTNGVGTVVETGGPVHIVGAEHFVEPLQDYACAGAPVRDPFTGRMEGVLDVSCRAEHSSPILHSLVCSAAGRIERAMLHDRDAGQQALFDLYTRVDARTRRAVLAVGRRAVLTNAALHALLEPDDLAALADHARFLMRRDGEIDDRPELPSGIRVRMRGTTVAVGGSVTGLVAVVSLVPSATPVAVGGPALRPRSSSPAWRAAWTAAAEAVRARTPLLVVGEAGSGRSRLLTDLDAALHGPGHAVGIGPDDLDRPAAPAAGSLVVLRDVDRWDAGPALAALDGVRVAATAADPTRCGPAVLARFRRSVTVPPLRDRSGDLASLVADLLAELAPGRAARLSADAMRTVARHPWPGNVPELRDALAVALRRRPVGAVEAADLPESCQSTPRGVLRPVDRAERDAIVAALRETGGNRRAAATALGVARSTLYRKIAQYGISGG